MPSLGFMQSTGGLLEGSNDVDCVIVLGLAFPQCRRIDGYPLNCMYRFSLLKYSSIVLKTVLS
jgi:hypothetical protein